MQHQQTHAEGSVRHAEKRRRGTCEFANRIARISLDAYEHAVPLSYRESNKQTCVAAVVAHFHSHSNDDRQKTTGSTCGDGVLPDTAFKDDGSDGDNDNDTVVADDGNDANKTDSRLQVMGLGVGTKFLPDAILREEQEEDGYGKRIRDCHAEVLARRAFRRQLASEISYDLKHSGGQKGRVVEGATAGEGYVPILERIESCDHSAANNESLPDKPSIRYQLKSNVTLHFYASSAPCGNAVLKKFIKMAKEKFDASLGPDEWPNQTHEPIAAHSLRLGQFALLVKKDGTITCQSTTNDDPTIGPSNTQHTKEEGSTGRDTKRRKKKPWPCGESDNWCPPSCSITNYNKGTIHSCSDKLCRWNCLGMQGSLLMSVLDRPLHMTTLTVGRKFSRAICQRAVCCRADGFGARVTGRDSDNGKIAEYLGKYKLNHPTLMETNVYMDEAGTHDMAGVKSIGQDATFDSNVCWVWWPEKAHDFDYAADCLDGRTGLKIKYHDDGVVHEDDATSTAFSECSTFAMFELTIDILQRSGVPGLSAWKSQSKLSLSDIREIKQKISSQYESVKSDLFRHRVFDQWSRREVAI
mmetsp:Transcript_39622/g.83302  ORF Transcript_39622/g.83302 Transcript_39622/m.83302 type:complete len:582 (+) Transcript_39622:94-1839(+)